MVVEKKKETKDGYELLNDSEFSQKKIFHQLSEFSDTNQKEKLSPHSLSLSSSLSPQEDNNDDDMNINKDNYDEPIPWKLILVGSFANATESFTSNILYPFVEEYCRDWLSVGESKKSLYAGLLVGIFNIGLAISNPFLGALSDRYGRKVSSWKIIQDDGEHDRKIRS